MIYYVSNHQVVSQYRFYLQANMSIDPIDLEDFITPGGTATIKALMRDKFVWDGKMPRAIVSHRLNEEANLKSSNWVLLGALKPISCPAAHIWKNAHQDLRVNIDIKDLCNFVFPPTSNISGWLDQTLLSVTYSKKTGKDKRRIDI